MHPSTQETDVPASGANGAAVATVPAPLTPVRGQGVAHRGMAPVDVMILTLNEEANLPHALRSVMGWANRVFVVDSGSTDRTVQIAREMGAEVVPHAWEGYARQKNWAIDHLPFESPWVFILDADEAITPDLREEIVGICSRPADQVPEAGFYVNRYLIFMGKRIRHCGYFPSWNLRLFKRGLAHYEDRPVHEHMVLQGEAGFLKGLMSHEDRRGLEYYIAKHNRYSTLEAETIFYSQQYGEGGVKPRLFGNAVQRRRFFRTRIYPRLPARWLGRFVWMYFINLGFLDGVAGLRFCLLIGSHELYTTLKLRELQYKTRRALLENEAPPAETFSVQMMEQGTRKRSQGVESAASSSTSSDAATSAPAPAPAPVTADTSTTAVTPAATPTVAPATAAQVDPEAALQMRQRSPWSFRQKVGRVVWMLARATLFRPSFHNWYGWRRFLLRCFGAKVAPGVRVRPTAFVEIPWNLEIGEGSQVGDYAILYSLGKIKIGRHVVVSQYAHLCAGTHDYTDRSFPLLTPPIVVEDEAWVAADAFVGPGVTVGPRAVVGARATVVKDVPADEVVAGNPARVVKRRELRR